MFFKRFLLFQLSSFMFHSISGLQTVVKTSKTELKYFLPVCKIARYQPAGRARGPNPRAEPGPAQAENFSPCPPLLQIFRHPKARIRLYHRPILRKRALASSVLLLSRQLRTQLRSLAHSARGILRLSTCKGLFIHFIAVRLKIWFKLTSEKCFYTYNNDKKPITTDFLSSCGCALAVGKEGELNIS